MEVTLVEMLVEELTCKSCSSQMSPPLIHCCHGHHECNTCIEKSGICTICKSPIDIRRDYFLENLCFGTVLKCSFTTQGCVFSGKALEVAAHEKNCIYRVKPFLHIDNDCIIEGSVANTDQPPKLDEENCSGISKEKIAESKAAQNVKKESSGQFLEDVVATELKCPVCLIRIIPPVSECHNGHHICCFCFSRTICCPVCRGPKCVGSSKFLSRIFDRLDVSCKNISMGCQVRRKGLSIILHEESCTFDSELCPMKVILSCRWEGMESEIESHCRRNHSDKVSLKKESRWILKDFKNQHLIHYNFIYVYGTLFRCCWKTTQDQSKLFLVNHMESKYRMITYTFDLKMFMPKRNQYVLIREGVNCTITESTDPPESHDYASLDQHSISDFCNENGDLCYVVTIKNYFNYR